MPDPRRVYLAWSMARSAVYTAQGAVLAGTLDRRVYLDALDNESAARADMATLEEIKNVCAVRD